MTAEDSGNTGGYAKPGFEGVQEAFAQVIAAHPGGCSAALYVGGEEMLHRWGGRSTATGQLFAFAYQERAVAFAFTCDTMLWNGLDAPDPRWTPLLTEISRALGLAG